jgi:DNA topoisomerase-1
MLKLGRKEGGEKYTPEEVSTLSLDEVKKMIETQVPGAFTKKAAAKKAATKSSAVKPPAKRPAAKKAAAKKAASKGKK